MANPLLPGSSHLSTEAPFQLPILLVESYVMTDGQSASLSWNKPLIWGLRPDFYYCQTVAGLLMCGALSDERTGLSLQLLLALASSVILGSKLSRTRDRILLSQIRDFPFCRLLRLSVLRWRYSALPPRGISNSCSSCPPYKTPAKNHRRKPRFQ
jgi:hypothetical protein